MPRDVPTELRAARRELVTLAGVAVIKDFWWLENKQRWALHLALTTDSSSDLVPATTHWYVLIPSDYPHGEIKYYPCKEGGLQYTFQHQQYNGAVAGAWRTGNICVATDVQALERRHLLTGQYSVLGSLRWHTERALLWLELAATGQLAPPGDPFELPDLPQVSPQTIAFNEGKSDLEVWSTQPRTGLFEASNIGRFTSAVRRFTTLSSDELKHVVWGTALTATSKEQVGAWVLLNQLPVLEPWQAPATWGELATALSLQGLDLYALLEPIVGCLRDGREHPLLLGFPMPREIGEPPRHIHWLALRLPKFSTYAKPPPGFRPTSASLWQRDRHFLLGRDRALNWLSTENWQQDELTARGRLDSAFTSQKVGVIGAGALGSNLVEQLVRAGVHDVTIVDGDIVKAGNLVRHTLSLADVGETKALALAHRLNKLSPHARVVGQVATFSSSDRDALDALRNCDLIIETTGSDNVVDELGQVTWEQPKRFASVSIGTQARRLYLYTAKGTRFPAEQFVTEVRPYLLEEDGWDVAFPREGTGCWHPVFPARSDELSHWAAIAVKRLNRRAMNEGWTARLEVYEQQEDDLGFGVSRVNDASG